MRKNHLTNKQLLESIDWDWETPNSLVKLWREYGLDCAMVVGPMGSLNGYVGVPTSHIWHGREYNGCPHNGLHDVTEEIFGYEYKHTNDECDYHTTPEGKIRVHGGLTFSRDEVQASGLASIDLWWFGFDTAQAWDFIPGMYKTMSKISEGKLFSPNEHPMEWIRDQRYVQAETGDLAYQLDVVQARGGLLYETDD